MFINQDKNIVNLTNSILKYYGVKPFHNTLKELDNILDNKKYKNIVLILCDGLGTKILNDSEAIFLKSKCRDNINSVFPPTTVAATTSYLTGKYPVEHCYLGWNQYVKSVDSVVELFLNSNAETFETFDFHVSSTEYPHKTLKELLPNATLVTPFHDTPYEIEDIDRMFDNIETACNKQGEQFIYAYTVYPDSLIHEHGTVNNLVKDKIIYLDNKIEELSKHLDDTLIIVSADHGIIDVNNININDFPEVRNMLETTICCEPRSAMLRIKKEYIYDFPKLFNQLLGDKFTLYTKQEIYDKQLFGTGNPNQKFDDTLGDYIAIAKENYALYDDSRHALSAHHAGITKEEIEVPFIIIEC